MLKRRTMNAGILAAFTILFALRASAVELTAPAPTPSGAASSAPAADVAATYSNIYQAPLFGSLSTLAAKDAPVDEGALRYYASLHNTARVNAEIKRLKALHPNWTAPTNLYSTAGVGNDEQTFWDLLAADRYDELHAAIALRIKNEAGWRPSRDLTTKIARKEAIVALTAASNEEQWRRVLEIVDEDPTILHCAYMDVDWRVADAFLNVGMSARAYEIYRAVIASCPEHDERLATIRKSISRFSVDQVKALIGMGAKAGDGVSEFEETKIDLTRARIAAINSGKSPDDLSPQELTDFVARTEKSGDRNDIALASWYMYDHERYAEARQLFALGVPPAPSGKKNPEEIKFAEGEALSLLKSGDAEGALAFAAKWRDSGAALRQTYATAMILLLTRSEPPASLSDADIADFIRAVNAEQNFEGAVALGWRWLHTQEPKKAEEWFLSALTWKGVDLAQPAPTIHIELQVVKAVEGYAQSLSKLGRDREAFAITDNWRDADASLLQLFKALATTVLGQAERVDAVPASQLQHYAHQVATDRDGAGAAVLGWLYYRSSDYRNAIESFQQANEWSSNGKGDAKTNQGLAVSLQRVGRLQEAEDVTWAWRADPELRSTFIAIVAAELTARDGAAEIPSERLARFVGLVRAQRSAFGAQSLGWYRLAQGNCSYAAPWFRAAGEWSADPDDVKTVEGLTLSLRAVGRYDRAEDLAYAWRERSSRMRGLFLSVGVEALTQEAPTPAVSELRIGRLAAAALNDRDASAARAIAWRRVHDAACGYGAIWFRRASAWSRGHERDPSVDGGYALALRAMGRLDDADDVLSRWIDDDVELRGAYIDTIVEELGRDTPPEPMDDDKLSRFAELVAKSKSAYGAQGLAWYRFQRNEFADAEKWFKSALAWWPTRHGDEPHAVLDPKPDYAPLLGKLALAHFDYTRTPLAYSRSARSFSVSRLPYVETVSGEAATWEGLALTLRAEGRAAESAQIAANWRDRWRPLRRMFVDLGREEIARADESALAADRLARYVVAIEEDRSPAGATAMAWRQYGRKNYKSAADWFRRAIDWSAAPRGAMPDPSLVEGYALALRAQKDFAKALALAGKWRKDSPRLNVLYLETRLLASQDASGKATLSTADIAETEKAIDDNHSASGAIAVAWAAYEGGDYSHALHWFQNAVAWAQNGEPDAKALEGVTLSLRGLGQYHELDQFARRWMDDAPEVRRAYYDSMMEMLAKADPASNEDSLAREALERLTQDDRNPPSAGALGWAKTNREDWASARMWFERALLWRGVDPTSESSVAIASAETVKLAEGYARALRAVGDLGAADDIAYAWRSRLASINELYVQVAADELNAAGVLGNEPRVKRFAEWTRTNRSAQGANRLGWLAYKRGDASVAVEWFDRARAWTFDVEFGLRNDEAYALALRAAGRYADAEALAWSRRDASKDLRATYVAAVIDQLGDSKLARTVTPARLERFAAIVRADKSSAGAEALGWKRLSEGPEGYAVPWFEAALAWASESQDATHARAGLAQALDAVGRFDAAERVAYFGVDSSPELRKLYIGIFARELTRDFLRPNVSEAHVARFARLVLADRSVEGAQALGWRRYQEPGCGYGADWLRLALDWAKDRPEDAKLLEGYALTLRAVGRLAEAETVVWPWVERNAAMKKLYIDVVVEELSRDFPPEPMADARLDRFVSVITPMRSALGAQAVAWYRHGREENDPAAVWFQNSLDWWPTPIDETKTLTLTLPVDDYKPMLARLALRLEDYRRTPLAYPNSSLLIGKSTEDYVRTVPGFIKTVEGYVLTLGALGRWEDAEQLAWKWGSRWPRLHAAYIDVAAAHLRALGDKAAPAEMIEHLAQLAVAENSPAGAEALAWVAYQAKDYEAASRWFRSMMDWRGRDAAANGDAVRAFATALSAVKRHDEALALLDAWRGRVPGLDSVFVDVALGKYATLDPASPEAARRLAEITATIETTRSPAGAVTVGWAVYARGDYEKSLVWFQHALAWGGDAEPDVKAQEGVAQSLRGLGRYAQVSEFARPLLDRAPELRRAYYDSMLEMLVKADARAPGERLARESFESQVDDDRSPPGAAALGWAYANREDWMNARLWFQKALNWTGVDPSDEAGAATASAGSVKLVEGYGRALRATGRLGAADDVGYLWRARAAGIAELYQQVVADELEDANTLGDEPRVKRFADWTRANRSGQGANRLGWLAYRRGKADIAVDWFERARAWTFDPAFGRKNDEAYALALRAAGRLAEAEAFAWPRRDASPELRATYVASVVDQLGKPDLAAMLTPARLERFAAAVRADRSAVGAEAMGWKRLAEGPEGYAVPWFEEALAWSTSPTDKDRDRAGLAQALNAVGRFAAAERVAYEGVARSPELRKLYVSIFTQELTREWLRPQVPEARIGKFAAVVLADHSVEGAQALGWRRYDESGCSYAAQWLRLAVGWSKGRPADAKLEEGYALALRAVGRLADAEQIARSWVDRRPDMKKLYVDIVVEELSRDNPPAPMPDERLARFESTIGPIRSALGAQAIGWYHWGRGETDPAAKWFAVALDWWPQPLDETKKLTLPVDDYKPLLAHVALRLQDYRRTPLAYPNSSLLIGKSTEAYVETVEGYAKTVEGYVLALGSLARWDDAEQLAWKWVARWPRLRPIFIDIAAAHLRALGSAPAPADTLAHMIELVSAGHSAAGAEALAWRAYGEKDYDSANRWFRSVLDWRGANAPADPDLVGAYAASLAANKRYDEAMQLIVNWRGRLPALDAVYIDVALDQYSAFAANSPEAGRKLAEIAETTTRTKSSAGASSLGWIALQRKDGGAALAWFKQSILWSQAGGAPAAKTLEGYARALQASKRYDDAMTFTMQWSEQVAGLRPLFVEIATQALAYAAAEQREVDTDLLAKIGVAFADVKSANGAQALAWQRIGVKDWTTAAAWFRAARTWGAGDEPSPKVVEGEIIALRALARLSEAEDLAFSFAKAPGSLREIYFEIVADRLNRNPPQPPDEAGLRRYAALVVSGQSAGGAETLGWYSYNVKQYTAASAWFEKSLAWDPNENAALGLALAYKASSRTAAYRKVLDDYKDRFGRIAELAAGSAKTDRRDEGRAALETDNGTAPTPRRVRPAASTSSRSDSAIGAALATKDYSACVERAMGRSDLSVGDRISLGWCLLNLKRPSEAARAFAIAQRTANGKERDDAGYGESVALLAAGETSSALAVASQSNLDTKQRRDLDAQALEQRAWNAYNGGDAAGALRLLDARDAVAPVNRDLLKLRAMALTKLGRADEAQRVDNALDSQLSTQ